MTKRYLIVAWNYDGAWWWFLHRLLFADPYLAPTKKKGKKENRNDFRHSMEKKHNFA